MAQDILVRGLDDWVDLTEVVWSVRSIGGFEQDDDLVRESLAVIRGLLDHSLMEIGNVTRSGFRSWDLPVDAAMDRVQKEWSGIGRQLLTGDVCWLANTPEGDTYARRLILKDNIGDAPD